ncbi:MAG TPA: hypothetical protein VMC78_00930 [Mycobacterium sp.]|nr:hypothetical protein [Mycobacterium sp.]
MKDTEKDPAVVIMFLVGRQLRAAEIHAAFGLSRSGYRRAQGQRRLITADNLLRVAGYFNLNPIELLTRFDLVSPEAVSDFVGSEPNFGVTRIHKGVTTRLRDAAPRTEVPAL